MTLADRLIARIRATGPLTVADYMADALLDPEAGYYATRDPLGTDFTTAPEISQMFGEMVGLALAQAWLDQGRPAPFALAELGPGRGTLMADALRATRGVPGFHDAARLHLVEASAAMRAVQAETLAAHRPTWHDTVEGLPAMPTFLVANEFLDALPIRQHVRDGAAWRERLVTVQDDALAFALGPPVPVPELVDRNVPDGTLVERCPALPGIVQTVADRLTHGGVALFVDYGHWQSQGDTLQALRAGAPVDPLDAPGTADLTAHVDFAALAAAAPHVSAMTRQGVWLERLGITARANALAQGPKTEEIVRAHRRLTHPAEMGDLFKVMGLAAPGAALPPGLEAPA
ncbi:class I SAM-dependent methyltransferase [Jannaschia seohaensis]|uniref:SAM-dependent MidA family methyltransferase n=1 Tax=Jannaschia seohaensis TaxID=475081 RepID=A0A2Y9C8S9_9RHOB|nr:SAM-dependent methyltransferase [Jannaschia seohaensis]PWJ14425.1 SAM-dependent MidA family methyltransferase [Jannaschia seohaensis]SSA50153.1 SAM-dependent methyltransferase, MidA family [Jannaschia seohaensis]